MIYIVVLLFSSLSWADAIEMPSEDCPAGATGTASHAGAWCTPNSCETVSDCEGGDSCIEYPLCVEESEIPCGGMAMDTSCFVTKREAFGPCNDDGSCAQGTCETELVCVNEDAVGSPSKEEGCSGCATGSQNSGLGLLFITALVLLRRTTRISDGQQNSVDKNA